MAPEIALTAYLATVAALLAREAEHDRAEADAYAEADAALREVRACVRDAKAELLETYTGSTRIRARHAGEYDRAEQLLQAGARELSRAHAAWHGRRLYALDPRDVPAAWEAAYQAGEGRREREHRAAWEALVARGYRAPAVEPLPVLSEAEYEARLAAVLTWTDPWGEA